MGAAMLDRPARVCSVIHVMNEILECPVTIKVRIGRTVHKPVLHNLMSNLEDAGASAITIHGRSLNQRYSKLANWEYIEDCAGLVKIPVIGNGDILSYIDAQEHLRSGKLATVMLGRGALYKPWIFTEIKESRHWDISATERLDILRQYCDLGLEHWGADERGVMRTRRFLLKWLSFL
eukprot:EC795221.1.p2 GENE.EC795221.1~~EC795221.1.p2  ORF type:complete len:185 (+),score=64.43 EC795221.1:22-555(+)